MSTRNRAPLGAPCWADLWTSDVEGSRRFYADLFGWEAQAQNSEFGGYFMFTREGVPVAGAMGDMPNMPAQNAWKVYLATDDIDKTMETAEANGALVISPRMQVADLGAQAVIVDPTEAQLGVWQAGTFPGFTVLEVPGAPSWFEVYSGDYQRAVEFYRSTFGWETDVVSDSDAFRYTTMRNPDGQGWLAGVMDGAGFLAEDVPSHWAVYFDVGDLDAAIAKVWSLGGKVLRGPDASPYGPLATVADPSGAEFKLRTPNP